MIYRQTLMAVKELLESEDLISALEEFEGAALDDVTRTQISEVFKQHLFNAYQRYPNVLGAELPKFLLVENGPCVSFGVDVNSLEGWGAGALREMGFILDEGILDDYVCQGGEWEPSPYERAKNLPKEDIERLLRWERYSNWMSAGWMILPGNDELPPSYRDYRKEIDPIDEAEILAWPEGYDPATLSMMLEDLPQLRELGVC